MPECQHCAVDDQLRIHVTMIRETIANLLVLLWDFLEINCTKIMKSLEYVILFVKLSLTAMPKHCGRFVH
jgi:hypothetical protein